MLSHMNRWLESLRVMAHLQSIPAATRNEPKTVPSIFQVLNENEIKGPRIMVAEDKLLDPNFKQFKKWR